MRSLGAFLSVLVTVVLLAGCTSSPSDSPPATPPASSSSDESPAEPPTVVEGLPATASPAWSTKLEALQNPVPAGDALVTVAAARGDEVDIVALDRTSGEVLWRRPMMVVTSRLGAYMGELVHESRQGRQLVVFQPAGTGADLQAEQARPYVAVEPSTGRVVARTRPVVARFGAPACDDGLDACLRISTGDDAFAETRWDLDTGDLRPERRRTPKGTNALPGSDVYFVQGPVDGYGVARAVARAGSESWRAPWRQVTGGPGWFLDDGTGFVAKDAGVVVVQALVRPRDGLVDRYEAGKRVRLDAEEHRTVGVALATGEVVWRHSGGLACLELNRYDLPVRCAFEGQKVHRKGWDEPRLRGARGFIEGYDPATGETAWRVELGDRAVRTLLLSRNRLGAAIDRVADADDLVVVPSRDGPRLLSLVDGSMAEPAEGGLLCTKKVPYPHRFDAPSTGPVGFADTRSRHFRETCDARGRRVDGQPGVTGLLTGATDAGEGTWVYATDGEVRAFRLS